MKKTVATYAILLATTLIACTKSAVSVNQPISDNSSLAARHGADDAVVAEPLDVLVPQAVIDAFTTKYPTATRVDYSPEFENGVVVYKVKFYQGSQRWIAFFMPDGTFISAQPH